jgi:hypothetical protein
LKRQARQRAPNPVHEFIPQALPAPLHKDASRRCSDSHKCPQLVLFVQR